MKPSDVMPENNDGAGTLSDKLPKKKRMISTKTMLSPNVTSN